MKVSAFAQVTAQVRRGDGNLIGCKSAYKLSQLCVWVWFGCFFGFGFFYVGKQKRKNDTLLFSTDMSLTLKRVESPGKAALGMFEAVFPLFLLLHCNHDFEALSSFVSI